MGSTDPPRMVSLTIPWPQQNLLKFLRRSKGQPRFYWESRREPIALAGFGAALVLRGSGPGRFDEIQSQALSVLQTGERILDGEVPPHLPCPVFFGGFSFRTGLTADRSGSIWESFGDALFVLPAYQMVRYKDRSWLTATALARPGEPFPAQDLLWNLPGPNTEKLAASPGAPDSPKNLTSHSEWLGMVHRAKESIAAGRFEKVVLARAMEYEADIDPLAAMERLSTLYPDCYRFLFEPVLGSSFLGATPELLAGLRKGKLETMALAGSAPRGTSYHEDQDFGRSLLSSHKDLSEHDFVVNEIVADLKPLVTDIQVANKGLLKLSNIQHIQTPIGASFNSGSGILKLVRELHPTPAVGGIPKRAAHAFILQNEPVSRGWYASPVGWIGPDGQGIFSVAIRSAVSQFGRTRLYAGAGIVAESDPELEWQETALKFQPMLETLL